MLSSDTRCTLCGRKGHRPANCPWRAIALEIAARLLPLVRRLANRLARVAARAVCHVTACKQVFRHNLQGRHDQRPHGVWECRRCGRVRLGRPIPSQPTEETTQ